MAAPVGGVRVVLRGRGGRRLGRARALVDEALEVNRAPGSQAYAGYFRAHLGWFARLAGDLDTALARPDGRRRDVAGRAPWWYATAAGLLASTLLEAGQRRGRVAGAPGTRRAGPEAPEAWRLRCLAPLARRRTRR